MNDFTNGSDFIKAIGSTYQRIEGFLNAYSFRRVLPVPSPVAFRSSVHRSA